MRNIDPDVPVGPSSSLKLIPEHCPPSLMFVIAFDVRLFPFDEVLEGFIVHDLVGRDSFVSRSGPRQPRSPT